MIKIGFENFIADKARRGLNYGFVTNPSAITSDGTQVWKACLNSGLKISALFGPEHGFTGIAQDCVKIEDSSYMGIPIYSLYGERLAPMHKQLLGLDAIIFDIQDIGCRYYTYIYTLASVIKLCAELGLPVIVLDRPNPIGGEAVEGSPIAEANSSFVGNYKLCHRHGMTAGEFANYLKGEFFPKAQVEVISMTGWKRNMLWPETGLPWHSPSPNMPSYACSMVYTGTCLFEGTELSEGRGTTRPFELFGAPWLDSNLLHDKLCSLNIGGAVFSVCPFNPCSSKFKGQDCEGILLNVTEYKKFHALNTGVTIIHTIRALYPKQAIWKQSWENSSVSFFDKLAGSQEIRFMLDKAVPLNECLDFVKSGQEEFIKSRKKYLLY